MFQFKFQWLWEAVISASHTQYCFMLNMKIYMCLDMDSQYLQQHLIFLNWILLWIYRAIMKDRKGFKISLWNRPVLTWSPVIRNLIKITFALSKWLLNKKRDYNGNKQVSCQEPINKTQRILPEDWTEPR